MVLCDTHCHLNLNSFEGDMEAVLERASQAGVEKILVPGVDLETSRIALQLAERWPQLYAAVGVHPNDGLSWNTTVQSELRRMAAHSKVAAIGEIGLDYYRQRCPHDIQQLILDEQLSLAAEIGKPVVIHNRQAFTDLWTILNEWIDQLRKSASQLASRPGVLHSYDGDWPTAEMVIASGFFIGMNGPVTFKNALERQQVAANLPQAALLIETDAPFLTPHPHRGERNEPSYVQYIIAKIADLRGVTPETLAGITSANANRLFLWRSA